MRGVSRCALLCVVPLWSCGVVLHDRVAMGTARLTVRNVGAITTLINANTTCGFLAPAVLRAPELSAAVGSPGTITWRTQDCVLDLGSDGVDVSTSCTGRVTRAQGRLTITAHKSVTGILTGALTGWLLGDNIVRTLFTDLTPQTTFSTPWGQILLILLLAYGFSLLTTILPALQAARIYPAEALRYE